MYGAARAGGRRTDRVIMVHVYFGLRPEKGVPLPRSMIFGWMSRDFYLEEHDPAGDGPSRFRVLTGVRGRQSQRE